MASDTEDKVAVGKLNMDRRAVADKVVISSSVIVFIMIS